MRNICIGLTLSLGMTLAGFAAEMPTVGQQAPAVALPSQEGKVVDLKSFKGKWVVLYFYPKDMTPGCTIEAHNFQQDLPKYDKLNAAIVGVSVDKVDSHQEFCTKESLTFKLLSDADKKVVEEYGTLGKNGVATRSTFLIDPTGKIVQVWPMVNASKHSEEVLAALTEKQGKKSN
jgi:thioredoxin-dependent peroxiredoxin